jgi:hypothetical protein
MLYLALHTAQHQEKCRVRCKGVSRKPLALQRPPPMQPSKNKEKMADMSCQPRPPTSR